MTETAASLRRTLAIRNRRGLHARASAKFVETVERFDAMAHVSRDGMRVDGRSIMGLLMLAAAQGSTIEVETGGAEAGTLMDALDALVAGKFGEED
jgi:phosphocarrier protein